MTNRSAQRHKFRPNPARQLILVGLALFGLAAGYGLGFVFKPDAQVTAEAPKAAGETPPAAPAPATPVRAESPPPVLPENGERRQGPVRAYEEALPKEIVVTVERIGPAPATPAPQPSPAPEPAPTAPAPTASAPPAPSPEPASTPEIAAAPAAKPETPPAEPPAWRRHAVTVRRDGRPMIAIVIDDLGIDKARTRRTIALPGPLSMSFLTYATKLDEQTRAATANGHELWMHVPMEPSLASVDPGPHALLTHLDAAGLGASLKHNLDRFGGYVGINNHMGSRFTADEAGMRHVMAALKTRGLAFLDSVTSGRSAGVRTAREAGVAHAVRNVFIDHEDDIEVIQGQLQRIERLARQQGHAIAIGHPRETTLKALAPWLETIGDKGFQLVPVSALLRQPAGPVAGN